MAQHLQPQAPSSRDESEEGPIRRQDREVASIRRRFHPHESVQDTGFDRSASEPKLTSPACRSSAFSEIELIEPAPEALVRMEDDMSPERESSQSEPEPGQSRLTFVQPCAHRADSRPTFPLCSPSCAKEAQDRGKSEDRVISRVIRLGSFASSNVSSGERATAGQGQEGRRSVSSPPRVAVRVEAEAH